MRQNIRERKKRNKIQSLKLSSHEKYLSDTSSLHLIHYATGSENTWKIKHFSVWQARWQGVQS